MTTDDIQILRLVNGEDIISNIINIDDTRIKLDNPMSMVYKTVDSGTIMLLVPWLPLDFINENETVIEKSKILLRMNPTIRMINAYSKSLISLYDKSQKEPTDSLSFFSKLYSKTVH